MLFLARQAHAYVLVACCAMMSNSYDSAYASDFVISEFNSNSFAYTFDSPPNDFRQEVGPESVRLFSTLNDSGGAGFGPFSLDFSSYSDSRFVIDVAPNAGNGVDGFDLELIDSSGNSGKWTLGVSHLDPGVTSTLVSSTTLANPTHGPGFSSLDLSDISRLQVVGQYSTPAPFDLQIDRLLISSSAQPPDPYPGMEPDAPWRAEAATRIDANRKANMRVNVTDAFGNPITGANVSINMTKHEFGFGTAVRSRLLYDTDPAVNTNYKNKLEELFNIVVTENNLKWANWPEDGNSYWTQQGAENAVDWLNARGIEVRGHNLAWPGYDNVSGSAQAILDSGSLSSGQQQQLRDLISAHIADIAGRFAGQLESWDVINEPRSNHDIMDALSEGDLAMVDWFQQALSADPSAKRYINDFGILNSGGATNTTNQQDYIDRIQFLIGNNAPIDGIGFQSHFREGTLTGPEQLWEIVDRFSEFGLEMKITEFDFETTNEALQAAYTRDFLTAMFAHEDIDDILHWGFWEGEHWRPDAALFRNDWSIKPNGQAFLDLVFGDWWTEENLLSQIDGLAEIRGFKGDYEVIVSVNGIEKSVNATLSDGGLALDVALDLLSADFDADGDVDEDDLATMLANYGQSINQLGGDANGDGLVNGSDFLVWQRQVGVNVPRSLTTVPEPTSTGLFALLLAIHTAHSRHRISCPSQRS